MDASSRRSRRQLNIEFTKDADDHIARLAKAVGKTRSAYVRDLVLDVLRDDALAHGETLRAAE